MPQAGHVAVHVLDKEPKADVLGLAWFLPAKLCLELFHPGAGLLGVLRVSHELINQVIGIVSGGLLNPAHRLLQPRWRPCLLRAGGRQLVGELQRTIHQRLGLGEFLLLHQWLEALHQIAHRLQIDTRVLPFFDQSLKFVHLILERLRYGAWSDPLGLRSLRRGLR